MELAIKPTKNKKEVTYKSIYIELKLVKAINEIARMYNTSFNNIVISMIEECIRNNKISLE